MKRRAWIAGLAVALVVGASGCGGSSSTTITASGGITVTGDGTVTMVPDQAEFTFGVHTQSTTAAAALGANSAVMTKVIAAIEGAGVDKGDVQTSQVSLSPQTSADGNRVTGYAADNSVTVTVKDLRSAGAVVGAAVGAGANNVSGPDLSSSNQTKLYVAALKLAMADAKAKAQAIAHGGGVSLGKVKTVVEGGGATPLPGAEAAKATPISPGTTQIEATVTVTYAIS